MVANHVSFRGLEMLPQLFDAFAHTPEYLFDLVGTHLRPGAGRKAVARPESQSRAASRLTISQKSRRSPSSLDAMAWTRAGSRIPY